MLKRTSNEVVPQALQSQKIKALFDIWEFADLIKFHGGRTNFGTVHKKLAGFVTSTQRGHKYSDNHEVYYSNKRRLVLMPRGHLKSTVCSTLYVLWRIYRNPDIRIIVGTNILQLATSFIREVRQYLEDPQLGELVWNSRPHIGGRLIPVMDAAGRKRRSQDFTETEDKKLIWTNTALQVLRPGVFKEPTLLAISVGTKTTGNHCDLIILDDIVDFDNVSSQVKIDRVFDWTQDLESVLDPARSVSVGKYLDKRGIPVVFKEEVGNEIVVLGTRYDANDFYHYLIDNQKELEYATFLRNIYRNGVNADYGFIWQEKFNETVLRQIRARLSARRFASQYLNRIVTDETSVLRSDQIQYFHIDRVEVKDMMVDIYVPNEPFPRHVKLYLVVDPAISMANDADNTCITVGGLDENRDMFIVDMVVGKFAPMKTIEHIYTLTDKWNMHTVHIEVVGFQAALVYGIKEQFRSRRPLVVREIKPDSRSGSKKSRIEQGLQPLFANNKIYLANNLSRLKELHDEIMYFPRETAHDDCLDTMEMLRAVACPVPKKAHVLTPRKQYNMKYGGSR